jgi:nitrilase
MDRPQVFRAAAAQFAPVFLDGPATLEKACDLMADAARQEIKLLAFPEAFLPGYPDWVWTVPAGESEGMLYELYGRLLDNAIDVPGPETDRLCRVAKQTGVFTVIGVSERNREASGASLYNTLLYIDAQGNLLGKHRKLVPTGGERLVWAPGDGSTLAVYDTALGKVGGLICWENYMPLARYALYSWGVQIYIAATWDHDDVWLSSMRHIAKEGGSYVISACMPLRKDDIPDELAFKQRYPANSGPWINRGNSAIIDTTGDLLAGPLVEAEGFVCAEIQPARAHSAKFLLDVAGHYARPDVFRLTVDRTTHPIIETVESAKSDTDED